LIEYDHEPLAAPMTVARYYALLVAALAALPVKSRAPELALVHAGLDSWSGLGAIVVGMQRHDGWHCRGPGRGVSLAFP